MSSRKPTRRRYEEGRARRNVSIPGALIGAIEKRIEELGRRTFSRYVIELVCYDLRNRRLHSVTGPLAHKSPEVQEAVDRVIIRHYVPGIKSTDERLKQIVNGALADAEAAPLPPGALAKQNRDVYFPIVHQEIIEERMRELRFTCVSHYVTSLIRYDLLLGGPHKLFYGDDCTPEMCAALDQETLREFHANRPKKCKIDYILEEVTGRKMSVEERHAHLRKASEKLCDQAVEEQKRARKGGGG